jgi:hypothetical protein
MRINEFDEKFPSVKTPTVGALAYKHNVTVKSIRQQLSKGIKAEMEHTTDPSVAKEIALDHLAELPDYYDRLEQMEEEAPPGREKQVKALKGKVDNPYAVAWASYNKSKK